MNHWIIAPVVLPALLAPFIVLAARYHLGIQRAFSIAGSLRATFRAVFHVLECFLFTFAKAALLVSCIADALGK